jgi:bacteriorhodopsin
MTEQEVKPVEKPAFWILMGIFVYCFSTFFVFALKSSTSQQFADKLWPIHNVVNIITYLLYATGLWKYGAIKEK